MERHRLGLWALGSPPSLRGLRARTLSAGESRADHPLPTRASDRVDPEPPLCRWSWWPLWAEASAKPAAATLAATVLLALHALAG